MGTNMMLEGLVDAFQLLVHLRNTCRESGHHEQWSMGLNAGNHNLRANLLERSSNYQVAAVLWGLEVYASCKLTECILQADSMQKQPTLTLVGNFC